ncbi:MAG: RNA polymerase sigma factor [Cyclobacteriaceae bacterium]
MPDYKSEFIDFRDELTSFLFRLVTNKQSAEDLTQDTFIRAFDKLHLFRGEASFKTWVFTIGTNLAKTHLKKESRWIENRQDYGANLHLQSKEHWDKFHSVFHSTPDQRYEVKEHIAYCFNCINKTLELSQQVCLLLKHVYHFSIPEIMQITDLSEGKVKHAIADARKHMIRIFDNRCSFVNQNGTCHQCTELTGVLNKTHEAHKKAMELKMVKKGTDPNKEHLLDLRLELTSQIEPLTSPNSAVTTYMLESSDDWVAEGKKRNVLGHH